VRARRINEPHRVSSPRELLFDLTFVAGISTRKRTFPVVPVTNALIIWS
jgi:hypothetical protein